MKRLTKSVVLSTLTALAFGAVAVGTTYALFTSKAEATVEVTAGKVAVSLKLGALSGTSPSAINEDGTIPEDATTEITPEEDGSLKFVNGGTAKIDGTKVIIENMTPGDSVKVPLTITNESTVAIKYRGTSKVTGSDEIEYKFDGVEEKWTKKAAGEKIAADNSYLQISLPTTATTQTDNTITVSVAVEAVQANAVVKDTEVKKVEGTTTEEKQESFTEAISSIPTESDSDGNTIYEVTLPGGTYTLPSNDSIKDKEITINGTEDTVIDLNNAVQCYDADLTFNGVTFVSDNADYKGIQHVSSVVYNDCKFQGKFHLYAESYFTNCEFTNKEDYSVWTYGAKKVVFDGCTFNSGGKAVLVYNEDTSGTFVADITVKNSTFIDDDSMDTAEKTTTKAAVETGNNPNKTNTYNLVFENVTVTGFAINPDGISSESTLWANKNSMDTDHLSVTIDGTKVY